MHGTLRGLSVACSFPRVRCHGDRNSAGEHGYLFIESIFSPAANLRACITCRLHLSPAVVAIQCVRHACIVNIVQQAMCTFQVNGAPARGPDHFPFRKPHLATSSLCQLGLNLLHVVPVSLCLAGIDFCLISWVHQWQRASGEVVLCRCRGLQGQRHWQPGHQELPCCKLVTAPAFTCRLTFTDMLSGVMCLCVTECQLCLPQLASSVRGQAGSC